MRGHALLWPLAIIAAWAGWRSFEIAALPDPQSQRNIAPAAAYKSGEKEPAAKAIRKMPNNGSQHILWPKNSALAAPKRRPILKSYSEIHMPAQIPHAPAARDAVMDADVQQSSPLRVADITSVPQPSQQSIAANLGGAELLSTKRKAPRRLSLYGYFFWRNEDGNPAFSIAPQAQYGGSQTGLVASYRLNGEKAPLSLVVRANQAIGSRAGELSAGLRWQPIAKLPVSISAEKRVRRGATNDAIIYLAGGAEQILPARVKLRGYGQAGVTLPLKDNERSDRFFDASIVATRKMIGIKSGALSIGAGAWAGGQRGVRRMDIGPHIETDLKIGSINLQLSADWRFRVGGNAQPKSAPAITVSASY